MCTIAYKGGSNVLRKGGPITERGGGTNWGFPKGSSKARGVEILIAHGAF